jgi:hypothetical protein
MLLEPNSCLNFLHATEMLLWKKRYARLPRGLSCGQGYASKAFGTNTLGCSQCSPLLHKHFWPQGSNRFRIRICSCVHTVSVFKLQTPVLSACTHVVRRHHRERFQSQRLLPRSLFGRLDVHSRNPWNQPDAPNVDSESATMAQVKQEVRFHSYISQFEATLPIQTSSCCFRFVSCQQII